MQLKDGSNVRGPPNPVKSNEVRGPTSRRRICSRAGVGGRDGSVSVNLKVKNSHTNHDGGVQPGDGFELLNHPFRLCLSSNQQIPPTLHFLFPNVPSLLFAAAQHFLLVVHQENLLFGLLM